MSSKPTSKASRRAVSMDSTSSQERMISETITHELTGENNGEKATEGPQNEDGEGDEGDEEDDEVYEIEKILHHSKNMFDGGLTGYYVKWKGYPDSDNSWVNENDCNAPELIAQYYAELKEKKPTKGKAPKRGRSSMQVDDDVVMLDGDPKEDRPSKKARKETTTVSGKSTKKKDNSRLSTSSKSTNLMKFSSLNEAADKEEFMAIPNPHDPQVKYDSMQKHWELEDWSPLIDEILTVDYASDSKTTVIYFMRLKDGTLAAATGDHMSVKAPRVVISFFERNLRFREDSESEK